MIAKAALNVTKAVADSQRTAPNPNGGANYASLKGKEKPEQESKDDIQRQQNGGTQQVTTDQNGNTAVGASKPNVYQGGTDTMTAYQQRKKYGNPYA